jgi:ParB-like chromosome segregation protein Spo0J
MEIRKVQLKDLKENPNNPRVITDEELEVLENSMSKFGYVDPIIWNERNGNIVGGHQRYKVLSKKLQANDEVEVVVVNLDDYQEKALNLALNKISGNWDEMRLTEILTDLKENQDELLNYTGFTNNEITNILSFLNTDVPNLHYDGEVGNADNIRYALTFYFEDFDTYNQAKSFFKQDKTVELNTNKLISLI